MPLKKGVGLKLFGVVQLQKGKRKGVGEPVSYVEKMKRDGFLQPGIYEVKKQAVAAAMHKAGKGKK